MISSGGLFFWLLHCILLLLTNADDGQPIRGVPGIDYPDYQTIPQTSFRCSEQQLIPGLYADPETGCQMFHHCYEHRHESFLCPPGTIFNQAILACDYWYSADCSATTSNYNVKSHRKASNTDARNPSVNIFNKLASLYEVKEPLSLDYNSKEDGTGTQNSVSGNYKEHDNSILKVSSNHDRREGSITEAYKGHSYTQYGIKNGDHLGMFDDFESSGEPDDSGEQENYEEEFSSLNDAEKPIDFEKQYFGYDEVKDFEYDSEHQLNNEELFSSFSDIQDRRTNSSKDHKSGDKLVKRQSKAIENRDVRKQRRRPIYTVIEHEANIKEFTTTELPKHKMDIHLNNDTDSPSYSQESVTTSNSVSTSSASKTKRRKPVLIQLEDSYEYNVDKGKISSIKYGNPHSNIPEFSMAAEEISVNLFPSNTKLKPADRLMQHQFIDKNSNEGLRSLNNIASHKSNIFHASTLSALDNIESFEDISKNLNQVYPKRKRNEIRIIDSENIHDVYTENEELIKGSTTFTPILEDDFTTQSSGTNFEDYDKFTEPHFDSQYVEKVHEMEDGNLELGRQLEDNHNVYVKLGEFEDSTTFMPTFQDELTTQSASTTFKNLDEFSELHFHDYDLENAREIEGGDSDIIKQTEGDHNVYIENEVNDATTLAPILEDEFTSQSSNTNFKDFDKLFHPTFDDDNIEIDHEMENDHLDLVPEQYEDSYSDFITPYPHIEMLDWSEDTHFEQVNPGATMDVKEYENKKYLEYIRGFPKYENFEEIEINNDKENGDYSFVTTEFSVPEISSKVPHAEGEIDRFYFNPNTVVESSFVDLDTSESLSQNVSETSDENNGVITASKTLSNHTNKADNEEIFSQNQEILKKNISSEVEQLRSKTSNNVTITESAHARVDAEVNPSINNEINEYFINENTKDKLNSDLLKNNHTKASVYTEENYSSKDGSIEEYDSYNTLSDINTKETEDFSEKENESSIETILHELEMDQNIHQSDEPMDPGVLDKMELKSIENIDKITETSSFEDSEIDSEDLTKILDDLENYHNVAENDPISDQEHVFNPKHNSDGKAKLEDSSKITPGKSISNIDTNAMNKGFSNLPQNNPGNIIKDKPIRIPRMFMPPYNRDFNFERFSRNFNFEKLSSQNFGGGVPYSMLQLKQKSMNKLLGSSMDDYSIKGIEDYYSTRTGDLLESPKISKLISIGKNLLNAKKAKLRILRKYVNY